MVAHAHRFAYVERDGKVWRQVYPDGRTTTVDSIDHLVGIGYQADELVAAAGGGVAVTPDTGDLTRLRVIEMVRDDDVPRARPWAA